jgi:hypothetical protein
MSCYSTGCIPTPPSSNSPRHSLFEMSLPDQQDEWIDPNIGTNDHIHTHPPSTPMTFSHHGLGLGGLPATTSQAFLESQLVTDQPDITVSSPWLSQYSFAQTPISHPQPIRSIQTWPESGCNDTCSTLMPTTLWDTPQPYPAQGPLCPASPAFRQYSPGEYHSGISTPYARSDSVLPSAHSPHIKIEEIATPGSGSVGITSQYSSPDRPLVVRPEDLMAAPSYSIEEKIESLLAPSPLLNESFAYPSSVRPVRRRAYSSADILEDKKKRGYTKPGDARCSCDQCGKLFQRTYNLKAHMETHDPHRAQPHTCGFEGCEKRFVRRTDLLRHQQSVSASLSSMFGPC